MVKMNKEKLVKMILNKTDNDTMDNFDELFDMLIDEPIAINVDKEEKRTIGEKVSDKLAEVAGSWTFIIIFVLFLVLWIVLNIMAIDAVDPYPFILLNLVLSCISAIQAPIIMMSQNREAKKEKLKSNNEYKTTLKNELILEELHRKMDEILKNEKVILEYINKEKK
jgi:uncharacterized membrane protein